MINERVFHVTVTGQGLSSFVHLSCVGDFMHEAVKVYPQLIVTAVRDQSVVDSAEVCNWCDNPLIFDNEEA